MQPCDFAPVYCLGAGEGGGEDAGGEEGGGEDGGGGMEM
jgi:hypothetical protein